jgi:hypothetical protein
MKTTLFFLYLLSLVYPVLLSAAPAKVQNEVPSNAFFIENKGQVTDQYYKSRKDIQFKMNGTGINIFIGNGTIHYQFSKVSARDSSLIDVCRVDVTLTGATPNAEIVRGTKQSYYENYYKTGTGANGVKAYVYDKVTYKNIYPGIDWVLYAKGDAFKYEFVVHPGVDPGIIKLKYEGASSVQLNKDGGLSTITPLGTVEEQAPYSYQQDGKKIKSAYKLLNNELSFETGKYNGSLTIDPLLNWATYYGGNLTDWTYSCSEAKGNVYLSGYSSSSTNIATTGSYQQTLNGSQDAFLARFDNTGQQLWGTYYGGSDIESARGVCCDTAGFIYVTGNTYSASGIATAGSYLANLTGSYQNAFLVKFDSLGNRIWGTYYAGAGNGTTTSQCISSDRNGYVYIAGLTEDNSGIASVGGFQTGYGGGTNDGFLVKFDENGTRLWATYYGGNGDDNVVSISCDGLDNVYLTGKTTSTANIATVGSYQATYTGADDAMLVKFDGLGNRLWGTYYGGTNTTTPYAVTCTENDVYMAGITHCTVGISTPGSYQPNFGGGGFDAFLTKFTANGNLDWSTYYGGSDIDYIYSLACNAGGVYLAGFTHSNTNIASDCGYQTTFIGNGAFNDAFFAKIDPTGQRVWGTYYGGDAEDQCYSIICDNENHIYIAGVTSSVNGIATAGSHQVNNGGGFRDAFLARFDECGILPAPLNITGNTMACAGDTLIYHAMDVCEASSYTWILPAGWQANSNVDSIVVITGTNSGQIQVAANNMCGDTGTLQTLNVTIPNIHPTISNTSNILSVTSFSTYQWYLNGQAISGANSENYTASQNGDYYVVVTDGNGCSGNSDTITINNVGLSVIERKKQLAVSPNPVTNSVCLYNIPEHCRLLITNVTGKTIYESGTQTSTETIDISHFSNGVYYIKLLQPDGSIIVRELIKRGE